MSFELTEEQQLATKELRKFLDKVIEPEFLQHGEGFIPKEKMCGWMKQLVEFGLIKAPHSETYGGLGLDWITHLLLSEEVMVTSIDIAAPLLINAIGADLLIRNGPEEIKQRYVPKLLNGDLIISLGISEPDVGSDVSAIKCRARRDGSRVASTPIFLYVPVKQETGRSPIFWWIVKITVMK